MLTKNELQGVCTTLPTNSKVITQFLPKSLPLPQVGITPNGQCPFLKMSFCCKWAMIHLQNSLAMNFNLLMAFQLCHNKVAMCPLQNVNSPHLGSLCTKSQTNYVCTRPNITHVN